jgi:tryptophan synthase alpha chain
VARVHRLGADAAIVGTAAVAAVERAGVEGRDVAAALVELVGSLLSLRPASELALGAGVAR